MVFHLLDRPCVAHCLLAPEGVVAVLIHLPKFTGKETTAPIGLAHHAQTAVRIDAARYERPVFLLCANLVGLLQLIAQLHVSLREGVVGGVGSVVQKEEWIGETLYEMLLGTSHVVLALRINQSQPIHVLCQLALLEVPLADLLVGPSAHDLA